MTLKRAMSRLRRRLPGPVKRFARHFAVVNRMLPPLTGGEMPIRLAARDLLRRGDIAFDVGANIGSHTLSMAHLVGRRGQVHAFEPNGSCTATLKRQLDVHGIKNCRVVAAAVMERSGGFIDLYLDPRPEMYAGASTVIEALATPARFGTRQIVSVRVPVIALDDYCAETGAYPHFMKIDIENAEIFALRGATRVIERRPHVVLEYGNEPTTHAGSLFATQNPALGFLEERGYEFVDLHTWEPVTASQYLSQRVLRNILAIHGTTRPKTPYAAVSRKNVVVLRRADFRTWDEGADRFESGPIRLTPGRYVASFDIGAVGNPEVELTSYVDGEVVNGCRFDYDFLRLGLQHLVFELEAPASSHFLARRCSSDGRLELGAVTLDRIQLAGA